MSETLTSSAGVLVRTDVLEGLRLLLMAVAAGDPVNDVASAVQAARLLSELPPAPW